MFFCDSCFSVWSNCTPSLLAKSSLNSGYRLPLGTDRRCNHRELEQSRFTRRPNVHRKCGDIDHIGALASDDRSSTARSSLDQRDVCWGASAHTTWTKRVRRKEPPGLTSPWKIIHGSLADIWTSLNTVCRPDFPRLLKTLGKLSTQYSTLWFLETQSRKAGRCRLLAPYSVHYSTPLER